MHSPNERDYLAGISVVRRPSRVVRVGDVEIGGTNPICVQSMTTTHTRDTVATADQVERLVEAGCELVRITTPSLKDVEALAEIRALLEQRRIRVPLAADVHFTPKAALGALEHVDKVRINPGNYADRKHFAVREYTDAEYAVELERVAARFRPLVVRARTLGRALRIGTNHGSLSDRVLNRYGDTAAGMVESALEFFEVCEEENFHDVIFSMKSSNPKIAIEAYRLLAERLDCDATKEGPGAPLHLGVTEAGAGREARIKSAIGIGTLLEEGLGDTIRVSLTEDSVREIPVARALAERFQQRFGGSSSAPRSVQIELRRRPAIKPSGRRAVRVDLELGPIGNGAAEVVASLAEVLQRTSDRGFEGLVIDALEPRDVARAQAFGLALVTHAIKVPLCVRSSLALAAELAAAGIRTVVQVDAKSPREELLKAARASVSSACGIEWEIDAGWDVGDPAEVVDTILEIADEAGLEEISLSAASGSFIHAHRRIAQRLAETKLKHSIALRHRAQAGEDLAVALLYASTDIGALLCEGIGDVVSLRHERGNVDALDLLYGILQGAGVRITKAEYISCPSCGRTEFDLESVTEIIRTRTEHLRDVKIAVMGCIVNGPGEMADADFGYVGSGPGKVHLYVGHERVASHVPEAEAPDRLEELIRMHDRWTEPTSPGSQR